MERAVTMIGIGTDVVELGRFRTALDRTPSIIQRVFTPAEQAYAARRTDPVERYAVRFAAKEAALKAMGIGLFQVPLTEIEVARSDSGAPELVLHRQAAAMAADRGIAAWQLTLAHTDSLAHAIAVAFGSNHERSASSLDSRPCVRTVVAAEATRATASFYEDVLGFQLTGRDVHVNGAYQLELGGSVLLVVPTGSSLGNRSVHQDHTATAATRGDVVIEVADLSAALERANRHGASVQAVPGVGDGAFVVADPDGRSVLVTGRRRGGPSL